MHIFFTKHAYRVCICTNAYEHTICITSRLSTMVRQVSLSHSNIFNHKFPARHIRITRKNIPFCLIF